VPALPLASMLRPEPQVEVSSSTIAAAGRLALKLIELAGAPARFGTRGLRRGGGGRGEIVPRARPDEIVKASSCYHRTVDTARARPWGAGRLSPQAEARFIENVDACGRFFMGQSDVQQALYRLTAISSMSRS
jgi:hypothetical protein